MLLLIAPYINGNTAGAHSFQGKTIAVTAVKNILCGGREGGRSLFFIRSTLPPLISDTPVTGLGKTSGNYNYTNPVVCLFVGQ